ncbi:MAG: hypothetical protein D6160_20590 [Ketobacter sp.]|nr:MAG: hypothetical protein D6160_20590 [Ketobacter sp.]
MARKKQSSLFVQTPEQEKKYTLTVPSSLVDRLDRINDRLIEVNPKSVFQMDTLLTSEFQRLVEQAEKELDIVGKTESALPA